MLLFGLIGNPLTHSFSKNYFTEKFKKEGIEDCRYENFQLTDINQLPTIIADNPDLRGFNVTIPYKESILPFLAESSELVKQIRACNCVKIAQGKLIGYNTDIAGFEKSLLNKLDRSHQNALILGTGGAAKVSVRCDGDPQWKACDSAARDSAGRYFPRVGSRAEGRSDSCL